MKKATIIDARGVERPASRRQFGRIEKRKSGNFAASYVGQDGKRYRAPNTFTNRAHAEAWLGAALDEMRREVWRSPALVAIEKLGDYAQVWIDQRRTKSGSELAPSTRALYLHQLNNGLAALADIPIGDLTPALLRKWHADMAKDGATKAGAHARLLRAICNTAITDELITKNPVPPELCRSKSGIFHRPPTDQELADIMAIITPRFKLAVILAAFGGLRLSEWRKLRRDDIVLDGNHYIVSVNGQAQYVQGIGWIERTTKSASGVRVVTLPAWVRGDVETHLANFCGDNGLLFPASGADFVSTAWQLAWNEARDTLGIRDVVREHDLRHYYGSSLADAGVGLKRIQAAGGWSSPAAALGYLHTVRGADKDLADVLKDVRPSAV